MGVVSFVIKTKVYIGTGYDLTNQYNDFFIYDLGTNSWDSLISPTEEIPIRYAGIAFSVNDTGYFGTGYSGDSLLSDLWAFTPDYCTNIDGSPDMITFKLYPNPVIDILNIEPLNTKEIGAITILDMKGQENINKRINGDKIKIDMSHLNSGVYFVKIITNNNIIVRKIIKE